MTTKELKKLEKLLNDTVAFQIATIRTDLHGFNNKLDNYIESDNQWKQTAQPSIDLGTNLRGFGKVLAYLIVTIGSIIALISGGVSFIKHLK